MLERGRSYPALMHRLWQLVGTKNSTRLPQSSSNLPGLVALYCRKQQQVFDFVNGDVLAWVVGYDAVGDIHTVHSELFFPSRPPTEIMFLLFCLPAHKNIDSVKSK